MKKPEKIAADARQEKFDAAMKLQAKQAIDREWMRKRGYRYTVSVDEFANLYQLLRSAWPEDARRGSLSGRMGFDCYAVLLGKDFADTIRCNANWLEVA